MLAQQFPPFGSAQIVDVCKNVFERPNRQAVARAVFSPIPGTPGMLSEVSPFKPIRSGISRANAESLLHRCRVVYLDLGHSAVLAMMLT
jgi:hypothetical protein